MTFVNDLGQPVNLTPAPADTKYARDAKERDELMTAETIAELAYECERRWEKIIGDAPRPDWDELDEARKLQLIAGVVWMLSHSSASLAQQHDHWRAQTGKGDTSSEGNALPYDDIPWAQQIKARLWRHLCHAIVG